jgi:transcription elongation factor Elf1
MIGGRQIDCAYCGKEKLSKNDIGLNKKLIYPQIERMMCPACMAEYFETTEEELKEMINIFKRQGCALFL